MQHEGKSKNQIEASNIYKWKVLVTVVLGTTLCAMDFSITYIAFPTIIRIFDTDINTVMWVNLSYGLVNISLMLILGKISDNIGRKKIYTAGVVIFTLGILACTISQNIGQLIFFRTLQGVGAAMVMSSGPAFITDAFPPDELGKGIGILNGAIATGLIIGPVLGGMLLYSLEWRSIFYMRIPVGIISIIMALTLLKRDRVEKQKIRFDLMGTFISSAGLFCLIFGVNQISGQNLHSSIFLAFIGLGIIFLIIFVLFENRVEDPIVDLSLFKNGLLSCFSLSLFLFFISVPAYVLMMPFYLMEGIGLSPSGAGLLLAVIYMVSVTVGPLSGMLSDRFGPVTFSAIGAGATLTSFYLMRSFDVTTEVMTIIFVMVLLGIGTGMFQTPNNSAIMGTASKNRIGTVSAIVTTVRSIGLSLGMAIIGSIYSARKAVHSADLNREMVTPDQVSGMSVSLAFHDVLIFAILLQAFVLISSLAPKLIDRDRG